MMSGRLKLMLFVLGGIMLTVSAFAQGSVSGKVVDVNGKEPLVGVFVIIENTTLGEATDYNGNYEIKKLPAGIYNIEVQYIGYKTLKKEKLAVKDNNVTICDFELEQETLTVDESMIIARKNSESEKLLIHERKISSIALENIGAKELSTKGLSTASDGVKKITGISISDAGQLFVRGLGDRYSTTTLNGLPIASPNPDNKLIPLDLFPVFAIKNIVVSKVYQATTFADYSGAHIDIGTRENIGNDFMSITINTGGKVNTLFKDFYNSDGRGIMSFNNNISQKISDMTSQEFSKYILNNTPFKTSFSVREKMAMPEFGATISVAKTIPLGKNSISLLASIGVNTESQTLKNAYVANYTAQGTILNEFNYDSYSEQLRVASLLSLGYDFNKSNSIIYNLFYSRNAIDDYKRREGVDSEGINLIGSNSVLHIYELINQQLSGTHRLNRDLTLKWSGSYTMTGSDEPDRRQVMFLKDEGGLSLFKLNKQETMRYFGELNENEVVGDIRLKYLFGEKNFIDAGLTYKNKLRDYESTRFYYNINQINPIIDGIYNTDYYLNQDNLSDGTISITKDSQPKSKYYAGNEIYAVFMQTEFYLFPSLIASLGLRYEQSLQWVCYWNDASIEKKSRLSNNNLFPAINFKYTKGKETSIRFSLSRTVTRPSFIEMAPFLYKESYGSAEVRGNDQLVNGYNYNADLRYEYFPNEEGDFLSVTAYYKILKNPIEKVQESSGGSIVHSFRNADDGSAAGLEVEIRNQFSNKFRVGFNASFMYTNVILPEDGGVYTDSQRALQGASPYLINTDITYIPFSSNTKKINLSLLYNLRGPRIHSVGIYGLGNIMQKSFNTLDFVADCTLSSHWGIKLNIKDILNSKVLFTQEIKNTGETKVVESFRPGVGITMGIKYNF
jgi:hypothetical protein